MKYQHESWAELLVKPSPKLRIPVIGMNDGIGKDIGDCAVAQEEPENRKLHVNLLYHTGGRGFTPQDSTLYIDHTPPNLTNYKKLHSSLGGSPRRTCRKNDNCEKIGGHAKRNFDVCFGYGHVSDGH